MPSQVDGAAWLQSSWIVEQCAILPKQQHVMRQRLMQVGSANDLIGSRPRHGDTSTRFYPES